MEFFKGMGQDAVKDLYEVVSHEMEKYQAMNLELNMARGKPCKEQIDLSDGLIDGSIDFAIKSDYRNYGILDGIDELKTVFADVLKVEKEEMIIGGNSSLNLMYDTLMRGMMFGMSDSRRPWIKEERVKFLCPVPGYDRHFSICEALGFEMININMDENGPDMDQVEALVSKDPLIKGIWCVPKYSNPTGITYSDEVVKRLASMKTAANDFIIMWDNAYLVHDLYEEGDQLMDVFAESKKHGREDRIIMFTSTSKITFPGAGVGMLATSKRNANRFKQQMGYQTIGHNKINQLMHARFLPSTEAIKHHMEKHAEIIGPKFKLVDQILNEELDKYGIATWTKPNGGYFISLDLPQGCAKEVVNMCSETGVTLTDAGATYPYRMDPKDSNIRIAPTFPSIEELELAIKVLCTSIKVVVAGKVLGQTYQAGA